LVRAFYRKQMWAQAIAESEALLPLRPSDRGLHEQPFPLYGSIRRLDDAELNAEQFTIEQVCAVALDGGEVFRKRRHPHWSIPCHQTLPSGV
jgi:hypothetical protein